MTGQCLTYNFIDEESETNLQENSLKFISYNIRALSEIITLLYYYILIFWLKKIINFFGVKILHEIPFTRSKLLRKKFNLKIFKSFFYFFFFCKITVIIGNNYKTEFKQYSPTPLSTLICVEEKAEHKFIIKWETNTHILFYRS